MFRLCLFLFYGSIVRTNVLFMFLLIVWRFCTSLSSWLHHTLANIFGNINSCGFHPASGTVMGTNGGTTGILCCWWWCCWYNWLLPMVIWENCILIINITSQLHITCIWGEMVHMPCIYTRCGSSPPPSKFQLHSPLEPNAIGYAWKYEGSTPCN